MLGLAAVLALASRGLPLVVLVMAALAGCSSLPMQSHRPVGHAIPSSTDNALGRLATASMARLRTTHDAQGTGTLGANPATTMPDGGRPDLSGFRLLPLGTHSLDARLQLVRRAQSSVDLQTFQFADDSTGRAMLRALRDAASRGVRVRVLVDDLYTGGADRLWTSFAAHERVEVRLFNPFTSARRHGPVGRFLLAPWDWGRINHRMHNKLFVVDGAWAIFGGRNVADAYYLKQDSDNFIDIDVLAAGALLPELQAQFDRYWNAATAFDLADILVPPAGEPQAPQALREDFDRLTSPSRSVLAMPEALPARDVLGQGPVGRALDDAAIDLVAGRAQVLADPPDKPFTGSPGGALMTSSVTHAVYEAMMQARTDVLASSPYFIPGPQGLALLQQLRERGVEVAVLTNSLASTDEPVVHLAYARYRPALLAAGVDLYELSHRRVKQNMQMFLFGASLGRLHSKTVLVDRRLAFVGSMNLDPRSATLNTEMGALIDSPVLAGQIRQLIDIDRLQGAYAVRLAQDGRCCRWSVPGGDDPGALDREPDARWWMRWLGGLLQPLAPENHL